MPFQFSSKIFASLQQALFIHAHCDPSYFDKPPHHAQLGFIGREDVPEKKFYQRGSEKKSFREKTYKIFTAFLKMNTYTNIFQGFYFYSVNSCIFFLTFTEQVFFRIPLNGGCCYCYICNAYSNSSMGTIIARNHLPFFKIFSNFAYFCPNSRIFGLFLPFFCPFSENCMYVFTFQNRP